MQTCLDRDLSLPYLMWIDPSIPLSADVRLIPRSIHPFHDLLGFISSLVSLGAMGGFMLFLAVRWHLARAGYIFPILMTLIALCLWLVPWFLGRRWLVSRAAAGEQRRGKLRQGILLGAEGLLVRMAPNQCYAIAWDNYVGIKTFYYSAGSQIFQVETLDGPINFPIHWLRATRQGFEREVERVRPATGRPAVIPSRERQRRFDLAPQRKLLRLVAVFVTGVVIVLGSLIGVGMTEEQDTVRGWSALGVLVGLLWTFGTVPYAFWTFYRLNQYDCMECGKRLPRADEFRPEVVFYCPDCGILWDTRMSESKLPHG